MSIIIYYKYLFHISIEIYQLIRGEKKISSKSNIDDINLLLIRILSDNFTESQHRLYDFISKKGKDLIIIIYPK